jgi:hypothetical protein
LALSIAGTRVVSQVPRISSLFEAFDKLADPSVSEFTSSVPETFDEIVDRVTSRSIVLSEFRIRNRMLMKSIVEKLHIEADNMTSNVHDSVELLDDPTTKIVVSTHQPNLFAYGGVFKKIVLLENLKNASKKLDRGKIVNLFVIIDHDFLDESWVRMAQLPSMDHSSGIMELRTPVADSKRWQLVCNTPLPSKSTVNYWKHQVKSWIRQNTKSDRLKRSESNANFEEFWQDIVETSYSRARSYSDLNAFIISKIVNRTWGYGTLFVRLSQLSPVLENGFTFLISNHNLYAEALRGIETKLMSRGIDTGISSSSCENAPVWVYCACGSKASAKVVTREHSFSLAGSCVSCKKYLELNLGTKDDLDLSKVVTKLSPRAIPIPLLLSRDLGISCYGTGTGGLGYLVDASIVAKKLALPFPPVTVWASKDKYLGIGQSAGRPNGRPDVLNEQLDLLRELSEECHGRIVPLLCKRDQCIKQDRSAEKILAEIFALKEEQRRIRHQIAYLTKARNIAVLSPCFIDYAVNFGAKRTEEIWTEHLVRSGRLAQPVIFS